MANAFDNWTVQLRKGLLDLCVLNVLSREDRYGYEIAGLFREHPGLNTQEGVLYPLLDRLRAHKLVSCRLADSPGGPKRKYYALTQEGRRIVKRMNVHASMLLGTLRALGVD